MQSDLIERANDCQKKRDHALLEYVREELEKELGWVPRHVTNGNERDAFAKKRQSE